MPGQFNLVFAFSVLEGLGVVVESHFEVTLALSIINVAFMFCRYNCFVY